MERSLKFIRFSCFVSSIKGFLAGPSVENKTERTLAQDTQGGDAHTDLSPPQRYPRGFPINIGVLEGKKQYARGGQWEEGKGGKDIGTRPHSLSFPFPSSPARFLFSSPQPTSDTKRPLRLEEREHTDLPDKLHFKINFCALQFICFHSSLPLGQLSLSALSGTFLSASS